MLTARQLECKSSLSSLNTGPASVGVFSVWWTAARGVGRVQRSSHQRLTLRMTCPLSPGWVGTGTDRKWERS